MINTFYSEGLLNGGAAFAAALITGFLFGLALEQAGFSSSRRLAGIFYFRDMTVLKVMFTAVIVCAIGMGYLNGFGIVRLENVYLLETVYGAQIAGGLLFGIGFVM